MRLTITSLRARADIAYREGIKSQLIAEQARADYTRLARENRERFARRGRDYLAADTAFGTYAVAKECIDTEQMHGRWSTERLTAASADYAKVVELMSQLSDFMAQRRAARPSPYPRQTGPHWHR